MSKAVTDAAPHRAAYWFATPGDLDVYWRNVYAAWHAAVRAVPWASLSPYETPLFPVFSGHVSDREFSEKEFGSRSVEGVLFGFREEAVATRVAVALRRVQLPQTLAVTCPAPSPDDRRISFPLTELLCPNTVIRMNRDNADQRPGFDPTVGLHVAVPEDQDEEHALEMAAGQPEFLPAFLIRILERTRGPAPSPSTERAHVSGSPGTGRADGRGRPGYLAIMTPVARKLLEALVASGGDKGASHPVFFINELRRFPGDPDEVTEAWNELLAARYVAEPVKFRDGVNVIDPAGKYFYVTKAGLAWLADGDPHPVQDSPAVDRTRGASYVGGVQPLRKFQIFVSATFDDLQEERQEVFNAVMTARHIPVGMEVFTAAHDRGWGLIKHLIDTSDYYVVVVGGRYGSVDPETGMSWTEREYLYALHERKIKVLPFVRHSRHITSDKMDTGPDAPRLKAKLDAFVKLLQDRHLRRIWKEKADLGGAVAQALQNQIDDDRREGALPPGWIRGDALDPNVETELREEVADLRKFAAALGLGGKPRTQ